jgi:hypothetical protein
MAHRRRLNERCQEKIPRNLLSKLDTGCGIKRGPGVRGQGLGSFQLSVISCQQKSSSPFVGRAGVGAEPGTRFALTLAHSQREKGQHAAP